MEQTQSNGNEYINIDLRLIFKAIWNKIWIVILAGLIAGAGGYVFSTYFIVPRYQSSLLLYVNNSSNSMEKPNYSVNSSSITLSQSLIKIYTELLKNRTTLERIIEKADIDYTYSQLYDMIQAEASNGTPVMKVTITYTDPYEAAKIANTIAEVLPGRISEIIDGASMVVISEAIPQLEKVSPNITQNTMCAFLLGVVIAVGIICVWVIMDDTVHDETYIIDTYHYPILAKVPDFATSGSKGYGYYKKSDKKKNNSEKAAEK